MRRYKKIYQLKKQNKITVIAWIKIFFSFFILFGGILSFFYFFQINSLEISGLETIEKETIEKIILNNINHKFLFFYFNNIFFLPQVSIRENLYSQFFNLEQINFQKQLPDKLIVEIKEKKPVAIIQQDNNFFYLDQNGIIFQKLSTNHSSSQLAIINSLKKDSLILGETIINKSLLDFILFGYQELQKINIVIKTILFDEDKITYITLNNWEIYFNAKQNLQQQWQKLVMVLADISNEQKKKLEYIDLRFDNFVFPKFKK